jgi:hypothetical protein
MKTSTNAPAYISWTCDSGHALAPDNDAGRAWIAEAERIMALPDNEANVDLWDEHSIDLERIGGSWL